MIEEKSKEEMAKKVIEKTMISQQFGEEIDWDTYATGVTEHLKIQLNDLTDFIEEETVKIQEKALKVSDAGFLRRMKKIFAVNHILKDGMKRDIESTGAAETAMDDGEHVRFFRQEFVDEKKRTRYYFNAFPQKKIDEMVEAIMQGRTPQMPQGQPPPALGKPLGDGLEGYS